MTDSRYFSVILPWAQVRAALDLLRNSAAGNFKPRPVGNRVVIDCEIEADAALLAQSITQARWLEVEP